MKITTVGMDLAKDVFQIGIVDAQVALQRLVFLALAHGLHQFMFHQPSRLPGDAKLAHHGQRGDVGLGLRHAVDRKIPGGQRQLGVLRHRAGAQTDLVAAGLTLPVAQLPTPKLVRQFVAAMWAFDAVRPSRRHKCFFALCLGTIILHELLDRETFLKLNWINAHDFLPSMNLRSRLDRRDQYEF